MKETRADNLRGTGLSVLGHGALIALILLGLHRLRHDSSAGGGEGSLQADLAKFEDLPAGVQRALRQAPVPPAPQPLPEPLPQPQPVEAAPPAPVPPPAAVPAPVPVSVPVPVPAAVPAPKPAKVAAPVPLPPPPPRPIDASKPVPPVPAAPANAGADVAKAKRAADLARQRAEQLAEAQGIGAAKPAPGEGKAQGAGRGRSTDGQQKWLDAVAQAIEREWIRPDDVAKGQRCPIRIRIIPGGEVISAVVQPGCPYADAARRSVEDAVRKASPLPFKGFEDVYAREFTVNFYPSR